MGVDMNPLRTASQHLPATDGMTSSSPLLSAPTSDEKTALEPGQCYQKHPALLLGQYEIYGGNAATPMVKDADLYVSLHAGLSCGWATETWDLYKSELACDAWESGGKIGEVSFAIPDGHAPQDADRFKALVSWLCTQLQAGKKIHVGCIGGHGRTGTVLAAITAQATGEKHAIEYVRNHYCHRAVETTA
jgi:hypothetical protein